MLKGSLHHLTKNSDDITEDYYFRPASTLVSKILLYAEDEIQGVVDFSWACLNYLEIRRMLNFILRFPIQNRRLIFNANSGYL